MDSSETGGSQDSGINDVQDGLQNPHNPISRDPEPTEDQRDDDEADGSAEGVNEAAGPAEEKDREGEDDRELTTDTSPSD